MEAPDYYQSSYCSSQFVFEKQPHSNSNNKAAAAATGGGGGGDHFIVEELLDFSNDDAVINTDGMFDNVTGNSAESSTVTVLDTACNSLSVSGCDPVGFSGDIVCRNLPDGQFGGDLCVPYDDLAELEWLSNFVEESFSSEDLQKLQLISGMKVRPVNEASETREFQREPNQNNTTTIPTFHPADMPVPAKARSKRSRSTPCNWTSRLLVLSPTTSSSETDVAIPAPLNCSRKVIKTSGPKKKEVVLDGVPSGSSSAGDGRKCLHCATDKTPQWRTGPMGPKTLCNACGVRYKSGRLVPEYRPAASPTFVLTKHSNSHRKVLELRRQKDGIRSHHQHQQQQQQQHHHQHQHQQFLNHHQNMMFELSNTEDYLIHQHVGPNFGQSLI